MAQNENELLQQIGTDLGVDEADDKNPVKQLRGALERRDTQIAKLQKDLENAPKAAEDKVRKDIERQTQVTELAGKFGYPKTAGLFLAQHEGDITEDAYRSFLTDTVGVEVKEQPPEPQPGQGQQPQPSEPQQPATQQIGTGNVAGFHQGGGTPAGQKRYTGGEAVDAYNRGELTLEEFNRAIDDGSISKADPGYVVHKQPG